MLAHLNFGEGLFVLVFYFQKFLVYVLIKYSWLTVCRNQPFIIIPDHEQTGRLTVSKAKTQTVLTQLFKNNTLKYFNWKLMIKLY